MKQKLYLVFSAVLVVGLGGCASPRQNDIRPAVRESTDAPAPPPRPTLAERNSLEADQPLTNNVTLEQLTALALKRNPELRIFEAEVAAAQGEVVTARTWQNPEATKAEVEVVNAQTALRLAQAQVLTGRAVLNTLLGRRPGEPLVVTGALSPEVRLPEEQHLWEQTLARNPSLKIQAAEIERTGLNLGLVRKSRYPDFTVGPAYESEPGLQIFSFGLSLPLPLWDQKKGPIATATAEQQRAVAELDKLRQEIFRNVTSAAQILAAVKEALTNYTPEFLGRLKTASDAAAQSYAEGRTPLLLFLETQRTYFETQATYFESLQRLYDSRAELESAVGVPLEEISKP